MQPIIRPLRDVEVNDKIATDLLLEGCEIRQTRTGKDYLALAFTDGTATLSANIWGYNRDEAMPDVGTVYTVVATIGEYQGKKQLNILSYSRSKEQDTSQFAKQYTKEIEHFWGLAKYWMDEITHPVLYDIVKRIYTLNSDAIMRSTSAKSVHHCGTGGNLVHSVEVATYAHALIKMLEPQADRSLLLAGALLHDIGKCFTYHTGPVIEFTQQGFLLDHITIGSSMIEKAADDLGIPANNEAVLLLRHLILSHHGKLEYGSPVVPRFMEAIILNFADGLSADMDMFTRHNNDAISRGDMMTERIYALGNTEFYTTEQIRIWLEGSQEVK